MKTDLYRLDILYTADSEGVTEGCRERQDRHQMDTQIQTQTIQFCPWLTLIHRISLILESCSVVFLGGIVKSYLEKCKI